MNIKIEYILKDGTKKYDNFQVENNTENDRENIIKKIVDIRKATYKEIEKVFADGKEVI